MKYIITTDGEKQGWMDSFNEYHNHEYSLNQEVEEHHLEEVESEIYDFNNGVAHGLAIRIEEVQDDK